MKTVEEYMKLPYAIEVRADFCNGEPCYMAYNCELRGCMAQGWTPEEAVAELRDAQRDYIEALLEDNIEIPLPKTKNSVYRVRATLSQALDFHSSKNSVLLVQEPILA